MTWSSQRLGHLGRVWVSSVDKHSVEGDPAVRLCNYTDVYNHENITDDMPFMAATASMRQIEQFRLQPGDTVFTKDSETADDIGVPAYVRSAGPDLVCGYHLAIFRPSQAVYPRFIFWAMSSRPVAAQWETAATGVTRVGLKQGDMRRLQVRVPTSVARQVAIADFLDRETALIDTLIEKQHALIERLRERRLGTIDSVLRTSPGVKNTPLRQVLHIQAGVTLGKNYENEPGASRYPYVRVANVQTGRVETDDLKTVVVPPSVARKSLLRSGDVLITEGGDRAALARGSLWHGQVQPCLHQNHIYALRPHPDKLSGSFLVYLLEGSEARKYFEMTRRQTTNLSATNSRIVRAFRFTLPSLSEQNELVAELDREMTNIDTLIEKVEQHVELARERRSALITAAVTGQIEVGA